MRFAAGSSPLKLLSFASFSLALSLLLGLGAWAQTPPANPPAAAKADPESAEERAQKTADRVFTWIRFHNEATAKKQNAAAATSSANAAGNEKGGEKASTQAAGKPAAASNKTAANNASREAERLAQAHRASQQETLGNGAGNAATASPAAEPPVSQGNAQAATSHPPAANPPTGNAVSAAATTALAAGDLSQAAPATQLAAALPSAASRPLETQPSSIAAAAVADEEPVLKLIHRVEPKLPRRLMTDFNGGTVLLRFVVQADGSVKQAEAMRSTSSRLSVVAVDAVSQWRFEPISRPREGRVEIGFRPPE